MIYTRPNLYKHCACRCPTLHLAVWGYQQKHCWMQTRFVSILVSLIIPDLRKLMLMRWHHSLQWHHNGHGSVSNHQPHDCLLNRLFRRRSKKTSKLRITGLCAGNSPGTGEFPAQMASNAENVSIWWRHHAKRLTGLNDIIASLLVSRARNAKYVFSKGTLDTILSWFSKFYGTIYRGHDLLSHNA